MSVETILLLSLAATVTIVVVHRIDDRTGIPAAALLTVLGLAYSLVPGPNITLDPHVVLTFVLPPLLYSTALDSSLLAIRKNLRTVISLSVVLVLVTAVVIGVGINLLVAGVTLSAGIALGACVAPPDPVAALAVGRRVGLPPHLTTLIQGEGLLNDATALTTLTVAVAAAGGEGFSLPFAVGEFALAAVGGVVAGVLVALAVRLARPFTADPLTTNAVSLATPFLAYLLGEAVHVSGVLAVVVAGLIVGHDTPRSSSGASRLQVAAVWRLVDYLLEGFVFLLIGQQLPEVVRGLDDYRTGTVVSAAAVTVGLVLVLRPLWLMATQLLPSSLHTWLGGDGERTPGRLTGREVVVLSWTGTRGVITLAAIFTIPVTIDGHPFPGRDLLLFCAFVVVLVTLVGQGMTFAPLVRRLGLRASERDMARLRNQARLAATQAALRRLDELSEPHADGGNSATDLDIEARVVESARRQLELQEGRYRGRLDALEDAAPGEAARTAPYEAALRLRRLTLDAQREELLRLRDAGQLPDAGLRTLERELDHEEGRLPDRM
ncbi:Na+/H+ antiporter [uncultured Jatrophihabitans sp.]|uniref:Na+/H+ antiporter n=1 Tax=uncultured Jatrophihabitans sp. TaxID=1610747 RepID=UPI0035CAF4E6